MTNTVLYSRSKNNKKGELIIRSTTVYRMVIMKKIITAVSLVLMACMLCLVVTGCGNQPSKDTEPQSPIASLKATENSTTLKVGESILLTNFYEIKGTSTLNAAQRACTYESSNPDVVNINAKRAEAVAPGTATITVTSKVDPTKSCTFEVVVSNDINCDKISIIGLLFSLKDINGIEPNVSFIKINLLLAKDNKNFNILQVYFFMVIIVCTKRYDKLQQFFLLFFIFLISNKLFN